MLRIQSPPYQTVREEPKHLSGEHASKKFRRLRSRASCRVADHGRLSVRPHAVSGRAASVEDSTRTESLGQVLAVLASRAAPGALADHGLKGATDAPEGPGWVWALLTKRLESVSLTKVRDVWVRTWVASLLSQFLPAGQQYVPPAEQVKPFGQQMVPLSLGFVHWTGASAGQTLLSGIRANPPASEHGAEVP